MHAHSPRQIEMLRLMGIDVWRHRNVADAHSTEFQSDTDAIAAVIADGLPADAPWRIEVFSAGTTTDAIVVCKNPQSDIAPDSPGGKLLDAILRALRLSRDSAMLCGIATQKESTSAEEMVQRFNPRLVLALGAFPAGWMRDQIDSADSVLIVGADLQTLLAQPDAKSRLWQSMVASGTVLPGE